MFYVVYYNSYIEIGKFVADAEIICCKEYSRRKIQEGLISKLTTIEKNATERNTRIVAISKGLSSKKEAEEYINDNPVIVNPVSFSVQWHFTKKCNQKCVQCYLSSEQFGKMHEEKELDIEKIYLIIDKFYDFCYKINASPVFVLTGGHPLLSDKLEKMLEYIDDKYRRRGKLSTIFILGNPQFLEENLIMLEEHNVDSYQISIDGLEKMHDEWRGKGSFAASLRAIEVLKKSSISLKIMATLSKKNAEDIIELYKMLCRLGAPYFAYSRLVPNCSDRSHNYFEEHFTPNEYKEFQEKMFITIQEMKNNGYKTEFIFKDHLWKPFFFEKGIWKKEDKYGSEYEADIIYDGCHINQDSLCIGTNGSVFACMKTNSYLGNVITDSFEEIYTSDKAEYFRKYDRYEKCNICKYNQYCRGCHAVSYGLYGDYYKPDPQCWYNPGA